MKDFGALTVNQISEEKKKPQSSARSCGSNFSVLFQEMTVALTFMSMLVLAFRVSWAWASQNALPTNRPFQGWAWTCICYLRVFSDLPEVYEELDLPQGTRQTEVQMFAGVR